MPKYTQSSESSSKALGPPAFLVLAALFGWRTRERGRYPW